MSVNTREQWELEFVDGLVGAGNENMKLTGGDDDRRQAMWNIANPIIKAIKRGVATIHFVGSFSVTQLNALQSKEQNGIYGVTDDGLLTNPDGTTLQVTAGSSVMWDGSWREFLDIDLSGYYTKEQVDSLIATAVAEFTAAVANESSLRESADATLQGNIDAEASERSSADNALDERVAYLEEAASSYEVNSNKVNAIDDSTAHYPTTHAVTAAIGAEATARESADSSLDARIDGEETAREQADGELQAQIDAISSKSDVVDVVASYAELVAYDTSALGDNDVIKVLEDETHDDAESYYRWNLTTQTWGYIGSQGPFVTPAEMQTALNGKVDKVAGKGLSTNDYTTAEKNKLAGIEAGADKSLVKFFSYSEDYADIAAVMPYIDTRYNVFLVGKEDGTYPRSYALVKFDRTNEEMVFAAMRDDSTLCTVTKSSDLGTGWRYRNYPLAPQSHASSDTTYGKGTSSNYGHVKLSDSTSSTSGVNDGVAATPSAVKTAYDLANGKAPTNHASTATTYGAGDATHYGHVQIESTPTSGSTKAITSGGVYDALGTKVGYALKNNVNVAGNTKNVGKTSPETLFVNNGLIMGGSAAQAGLVTRGICGVTTPSETNGACEKECLYVNYDGGGDYTYKSSRQLVIQAGNVGTHYGDNLYQYAAVRGDVAKAWLDKKVDKTTTVNGHALSGNVTVSKSDLGFGNFSPGTRIGLYGLEIETTEVVNIALSGKVYDTTLFVEYCRSSSDADGHHPALLAISFRYIEDQDDKWVSTPRMAVLYSFNAAGNYFKPELKYTADGHILLNLSSSRRHAGQVTIIASSANCSFITVSKLAMSSSVWTGATAVTDVRVNAIDDAVVHKAGNETITGVKTVSTSDKIGFTLEDDTDARLRARQTGSTTRYIQLDVESGTAGSNVAVYARNGNTNGSYLVSIDSSTVNPGGRGISCLGQSTDTVVRLGSKKLDFSGTLGTDSNTLYFV